MDYHVLNSTKRKKSLFVNFLPNTQNRFIAISKYNNQIIRLKTQSQTPSKYERRARPKNPKKIPEKKIQKSVPFWHFFFVL
ncbi:hypothetical protein Hanom_Chr13g01183731 [Helianthus anomalus]